MYKNQYLITNVKLANTHKLKTQSFNNLNIYSHPSLNSSIAKKRLAEILLLGYIINPLRPSERDDDIVCSLAETCKTKEALLKELQLLSGRFVLLYKNDLDFIVLNDACALRQLYYGFVDKNVFLTSSPKMFLDFYGKELEISDLKQDFINLKEYEWNECAWFGDKCIDNRLKKVLPNHFLDITNKRLHRTPIYCAELVNERDILEYSSAILKGSIDAIAKRYQVILPLTAGWESRTLLAASKKFKDTIQFFVFDQGKVNYQHSDVWVPQKLSAKLGLNFQVIKPEKLKKDFLTIYQKEHVSPKILPRITEIQYFYYNYSHHNVVRISGNSGGVFKSFYGHTNHKIDNKMLAYFSWYSEKSKFVNQEINFWLYDAKKYCEECDIPLLDLFYWEQRIGNWGALYAFEQDIAIEEFCPHSNKNLLLSILRINSKKRSSPKCTFIHSIIKYLWDDTLVEPINPVGYIKHLNMIVKRNSMRRYYILRAKSILQSFKNKGI